jgi:O-antigen/teichoic acid export membrane protein
MSIAGTLGLLFDQASIALHRSDQVLVRGVSSGVVRLALIAVLPFVVPSSSSELIFVAWVIGSLVAIVLALLHLRRSRLQYRYKPEIEVGMAQRLLRVGLPNHALTLADRAPGLIMPILATEIMSPASGAYWYTLWMMAWVVFVIPQSVGITLFAEAADRPEHLARGVRHGLRTAFALGALAAVFLGVFAHLVLRVLGPGYAAHGATPLRALVLSVFPLTIIQLYFAVSRTLGRLREAVLTGTLAGVTVIGLAVVAGQHAGLTGMAIAWLGTQLVAATWAGLRLRRLVQRHSAALNAAAALA